jgi:CubicO group peptidase (beta-lactamase class C family)
MFAPFVVAFALAATTTDSTVVVHGEVGRRLDAAMRRAAAHGMVASILVAKGDTILLRKAYGPADRVSGRPLSPANALIIGSITKQFTATAVMALVADGKLKVTDTLGALLPGVAVDKRGITVHQLLTHTAGLPYLIGDTRATTDRQQLVREMLARPLATRPGTMHAYANPGYTTLSAIVERVSGVPFQQFVRRRLFAPAGLTHTWFLAERAAMPSADQEVHSFTSGRDEGPVKDFPAAPLLLGTGDLMATPDDLYRWVTALRTGRVLPAAQRDALWASSEPTPQPNTRYAYGWNVITLASGATLVDHGGDLGGYNTDLRYYPNDTLTIVVLATSRLRGAGEKMLIANELSNVVRGRPGMPIPALADAPVRGQRALAGTYALPGGGRLQVREDGDGLRVSTEDAEGFAALLAPDSAGTARAARWSAGADSLLTLFAQDRTRELAARFHPALQGGDLAGELSRERGQFLAQWGALRSHRVIGTQLLGPQSGATEAVLEFERQSVAISLVWEAHLVFGFDAREERAIALRFAVESDSSAAAYDLISGRTVRVARDGPGILVDGASGRRRAVRVSG